MKKRHNRVREVQRKGGYQKPGMIYLTTQIMVKSPRGIGTEQAGKNYKM
jgi:hypothetical protein